MQRRYAINGNQTGVSGTGNADGTILGLTSATTIRPTIYFWEIGSGATPGDQAINVVWQRFTAAGTSTAVTPSALDPGDPASLATGGTNHTVAPTYTAGAILQSTSFNQQNTFKFETLPEYGMKCPATAANGLGLQFVLSTGTPLCEAAAWHAE